MITMGNWDFNDLIRLDGNDNLQLQRNSSAHILEDTGDVWLSYD